MNVSPGMPAHTSDLATRIANLTPEKRALLIREMRQQHSNLLGQQTVPRIAPVARSEELPLSFAQQRLWFLDQLEPGNSFYNMPAVVRLSGSLTVTALEQSLREIVRRHEALRTTFANEGGRPVQRIAPMGEWALPVVDLSGLAETEREAEALRLARAEAYQPFDLAQGPLLRVTLLHLDSSEHVLLLIVHHIVSDGWSIGVFMRELGQLYVAFTAGAPSPLPELPIQYADFAHWQREWLQGEVLQRQLKYWAHQLDGVPAGLDLPTDQPRPPVQTFRGAQQSFVLSAALHAALRELSRQAKATLFMTLLGAFQTLLYRYTGQTDLLVGSPIANRNRAELEDLIGFFVNTLVLRTDLSGNPTFSEVLQRVREVTLEAYAHQDLPFEQLVEVLQPWRDPSRNPLFQVMFQMQNTPRPDMELAGISLRLLEAENITAKFDLSLDMQETAEGLVGVVEYNTDLFEASTIERLLAHFQILLAGMVANPEQRVGDLPLLTVAEREQVLYEWNATATPYPQDQCIHQLFEAQVARTPDAVAVVFEDAHLTYQALNARANQLAHYLRERGVGPEVLVGICVERSLEMVIGLLGILKAGGAYVPLDPTYPQERLAFMLQDAQVPVLLTQQSLLTQSEGMPASVAHVVCLDTDWPRIAAQPCENPTSNVQPDNLAYVIYTSGSTGQPKGVVMAHCALYNHMRWMQDTFAFNGNDRVLQKTSFSFDASIWEFYAPLLSGGQLIMAPPRAEQDSARLVGQLLRYSITILQVVPSLLTLLVMHSDLIAQCMIRQVFCGGEPLSADLQERYLDSCTSMLCNLYGPTEACIDAMSWICTHVDYEHTVPIGRPIANTQVYVLDEELQPVPIGVGGELYIGGVGVARGYLNQPELTAERFIPHPFSLTPGARLYHTGDLARYLPDGTIEFLGRIDHQVKIRGFRIELGEIESALRRHPAVHDAVVMAREDVAGDKRLVAYVVARQELAPNASGLRSHLQESLPEHMIPAAFVPLDTLPLTPSGKVDRRALPAPDQTRPDLSTTFVAPRTPVEEVLAGIWSQVLGLDQIGIHDNFFELGGHSLLATQVVSRLREAFAVELPLRHLFEAPTIAKVATEIVQMQVEAVSTEELSALLTELEQLSDHDAQERLDTTLMPNVNKQDSRDNPS